ncbi:MAG: hypothetical protein Q7S30_01065 [Candidatus Omnitrophota bacterium]|nr:hypothetical protein [Candidatus Omnitrophota bacterium]
MKKIFMIIVACAGIAGSGVFGYCQYTEDDDSAIEQTESQMGQSLDSEMSSEQSQGKAESSEANSEFGAGEAMTL